MRAAIDWLLDKQIVARRRLVRDGRRAEPRRLVLRVRQRFLSRRRRHGDGRHGAGRAVRADRPTRAAAAGTRVCSSDDDDPHGCEEDRKRPRAEPHDRGAATGRALAAGDAKPRRRLGRLRSRQRHRVPLLRAVRRSQRDDRPEHARPDGPRARSARHAGPPRRRSGRRSGASPICARRKKPTAVGSAAGASTTSTAPGKCSSACRPSACRRTIR